MNLIQLKKNGHWPTLVTAFLYFDVSFMVWTMLGALGVQIGMSLGLSPQQKGLMVAVPYLSGAFIRIALGLLVDRMGAKNTGIVAQLVVIAGMTVAWRAGLHSFHQTLAFGAVLGVAGASFAVALPQAGRWYPPQMQGLVLGLAGAGNIGVVIDSIFAPRLANAYGWNSVFGLAVLPLIVVLVVYLLFSREAPIETKKKKFSDYLTLLKQKDAHWFCLFYTVSFGGFSGLAASLIIYFTSEFGLTAVRAGEMAALCTLVGAVGRPVGGALADRLGGIRALYIFYLVAGTSLTAVAFLNSLWLCTLAFFLASGAFGMANGSVFQLLPQRFPRDLGVMTGLAGCGGGIGGFLLASSLGYSKGLTGTYLAGLLIFAGLCVVAIIGLGVVKTRWRTTWGVLAAARI
ncbi:MAG TPA: MFS transporter [Lacunisphaera sp.]|jgi:NNP family nitrate/nitrite transporter-like MFS transporter